MDDLFWIGGVWMVTLILLPVLQQMTSPKDAMAFFTSFRGTVLRLRRA